MKILHRFDPAPGAPGRKGGRLFPAVASAVLAFASSLASAAPGELSQAPLFLGAGVQPNILLLLDDSGSMSFEVLKTAWAQEQYPGKENRGFINFEPQTETEKLELCAGYNALTYDPTKTYTPWVGKDKEGAAFQDQLSTSASVNPYTGGDNNVDPCEIIDYSFGGITDKGITNINGVTCNLETGLNAGHGFFFYEWKDDSCDLEHPVYVSTLGAKKANYANWFSYYRKREYVMKRALSEIIDKSRARVGLAGINKPGHLTRSGFVGTQVTDIDDLFIPHTPEDEARRVAAGENKEALLDNLVGLRVENGGTPLRSGLLNTGEYFKGNQTAATALFGHSVVQDPDTFDGISPILSEGNNGGECQQNFTVLVSDGFWDDETIGVGNTDGPRPDGDSNSPFDGQSYADDVANTLADIAMKYYEEDLMPNLPNAVLKVGDDENKAQHLVTFAVAFGVDGNLTADPPIPTASFNGWPTQTDLDVKGPARVDDMRHAAWNGRGQFLSAKSPGNLVETLQAAISSISQRNATAAAAVAVNSASVGNDTLVFQAAFDSTRWSGALSANKLTTVGVGVEKWEAGKILTDRTSPRIIVTYDGTNGIPFQFDDLTAGQKADLLAWNGGRGTTSDDALVTMLVAYLRGDGTREEDDSDDEQQAPIFRKRDSRLGDIVHSAPVFVGPPDPGLFPTDSGYQTWAASHQNRLPMVYVGSNDGMLHGFKGTADTTEIADATDGGEEVFAYVPNLLFAATDGGLHLLAELDYKHRYYVDQTPTVGEVYVDTGDGQGTEWHTVLVGALRGGGRGLFALDVTNPDTGFSDETTAKGQVLWEFQHQDLGYTFSQPTLAKLNNGNWAAIFGNGYNPPGGDGHAELFIVYLDGTNRNNPIILDTGVGSKNGDCVLDLTSDCNGLATPAVVDLNGDGTADRVYAGDLKGNLWVFDLSDASKIVSTNTPSRLFTAVFDDGTGTTAQPITSQPAVTLHPTQKGVGTEPNLMLFFGTGQFLTDDDRAAGGVQSFYGLWDTDDRGTLLSSMPIDKDNDLVKQTITHQTLGTGEEVRTLGNADVDYASKRGWYVDFDPAHGGESGERVVGTPVLFGPLVVYTTIVPTEGSKCSPQGGSWLMVQNLLDGKEPPFIAIDVTGDGNWTAADDVDDEAAGNDQTNHNVAGVRSGKLLWQAGIVKSGVGQGTVLLPRDKETGDEQSPLETQQLRAGTDNPLRSSWTRFSF